MQRNAVSGQGSFCALLALVLLLLVAGGCSGETQSGEDTPGDEASAEAGEDGGSEAAADEDKRGKEEDDSEKKEDKQKKPKKERATSIKASPVSRAELVIPVIAEGSIRARYSTEIKFEIAGRIEKVWVQEGQRVRKGQKLVSLDDREYRLALEEARARYLQALGQLAVEEEGYNGQDAERSLEERTGELKKLERDGVITRQERLDRELELGMEAVRDGAYRRELLEVRSGLSAARADSQRCELDLERTELRAPFTGVITGMTLSAGERVQVGQLLGRLVDDVNIEAEVGVLESDLGALEVGRLARLTIPALQETFEVQVDVISPEIEEESRTCRVLLRMRSEDGRVKPGMFARAAIAGQIYPDRLLVPREAILTRDGRPMLFKVEEDRARWVYVKLGLRNDHVVEIARVDQGGPLDPGTLVVVDNHLTLTHDAKVKVKKRLEISDPWTAPAAEEG